MPEILVAGNINADRVLRLGEAPRADGKQWAEDLGLRLGGAAANAASALCAAGDRVRLAGFGGADGDIARQPDTGAYARRLRQLETGPTPAVHVTDMQPA